jgi:hypothetical protein
VAEIEKDAAEDFIAKWQGVTASELSTSQSFLADLCRLLGVDTPHAEAQQAYMFERPITFAHGDGSTSAGRIDLYRRGAFVLESKKLKAPTHTKGFDDAMLRARSQAEQYARALPASEGRPPFLIVVDVGNRIELYAEFSRSGATYTPFPDPRSHRIALADLRDQNIRARLRRIWTDPLALDPSRESARVTREIAPRLATLARSLENAGQGSPSAASAGDGRDAGGRATHGAVAGRTGAAAKHSPELVAQFLMRCLFTMFAEDVTLLPANSFRDLLIKWADRPDVAMRMLAQLWRDMDGGGFSAAIASDVLRFNGKLFKHPNTLPLTHEQIALLIEAAKAKWEHVEPAIFGTLLERALDPTERHKLGAHYTPRAYVERLVLPTVIEPLRSEWSDAHAAALTLAAERKMDEAVNTLRAFHHRLCSVRVLDPACGSGNFLYVTLEHLKRLEGEVLNALDELGFRQPGLAIDGKRADAFGAETVDPHQLLGIELNPRAAAIAEVVLWIGYLQWHYRTRGDVNPPQPVIRDFRNIENRDAVLAYDHMEYVTDDRGVPVTRWDGVTMKKSPVTGEDIPDDNARMPLERYVNPRKAVWPEADFVVGNPPFIGKRNMRISLGDGYVEALRETWPQVPDSADFVMYWWHHAAVLTRHGALRRFGFITTNSIRQTFNRRVIEAALAPTTAAPAPSSRRKPGSSSADKKLHSGVRRNDEDKGSTPLSLVFAIPDHPWVDTADGAAVRIAMTVCEAGKRAGQWNEVHTERAGDQDEVIVDTHDHQGVIQADLTIGANLRLASTLGANAELSNIGVIPLGAGFWISESDADTLGEGLPALLRARLLREYRNGRDLTDRPRHIFAIDTYGFGEAELRSKAPRIWQWLHDRVKPDRDQNPRRGRRENWWRYGEDHPRARRAIENLPRYLATVMTAKHRVFQFLDGCLLPDQKLVVIGLDDAYFLGVLSSEAHVTWAIAQGSTLEDRPVYVKTACFERFPFPLVGDQQRVHLRTLAEQLDAHRKRQQAAHPELTLTGMYNVLDKLRSGEPLTVKERTIHEHGLVSVLRQLHDEIDAAVLDAYGWSDLLPLLRIAMGMDARVPRAPDAQERPMGMDARVPRAQATAGMPEVEQRMEQLPDAQERPMGMDARVPWAQDAQERHHDNAAPPQTTVGWGERSEPQHHVDHAQALPPEDADTALGGDGWGSLRSPQPTTARCHPEPRRYEARVRRGDPRTAGRAERGTRRRGSARPGALAAPGVPESVRGDGSRAGRNRHRTRRDRRCENQAHRRQAAAVAQGRGGSGARRC